MIKVSNEQAFQEQISQSALTIAVFKATWCKDCHYIEPFMPAVEQAYAGRITFIELDRDEVPDLCEQLNILGYTKLYRFPWRPRAGSFRQ